MNPICILQRGRPEQRGEKRDSNEFIDFFRDAILKNTTISSISYCKAVMGSGQTAVNGKGQAKARRAHWRSLLFFNWHHWACCTSVILKKLKNASILLRPASADIWSTFNDSSQTRSLRTRPCPGHKPLFRQPYLVWGVKREQWITLGGPTQSKHWALSDYRTSSGVISGSRSCLKMCIKRPAEHMILTRGFQRPSPQLMWSISSQSPFCYWKFYCGFDQNEYLGSIYQNDTKWPNSASVTIRFYSINGKLRV